MALQYSATVEATGATASEAYARITGFSYASDRGESVRFSVDVFFNAAARTGSKNPMQSYAFEIEAFDFSEQKAMKQALYEFLKTQTEFSSAVDV